MKLSYTALIIRIYSSCREKIQRRDAKAQSRKEKFQKGFLPETCINKEFNAFRADFSRRIFVAGCFNI